MIVDGRAVSADILKRTKERVEKAAAAAGGGRATAARFAPIVRAIVMSSTAATESYLRVKSARAEDAGMQLEIVRVAEDATTEEVIGAVRSACSPDAAAVIVQLPLPDSVNSDLVLDEIALSQDADVLSSQAYENFVYSKENALLPPVVGALKKVLARSNVDPRGKRAVIVGSGRLVGQPAQVWLEAQGADVTAVTRQSGAMEELAQADIIVAGAGAPHLITPNMIKDGVVLIDAGTSESNGAIAGDADPACADKASLFTPVPGGMGPIAVACLFENAASLFERAHRATPSR